MKIRLLKPFPQPSLGKVIPAGVVIDAPDGLWERLLRDGTGMPAHAGEPAPAGDGSTESGGTDTAPKEPEEAETAPEEPKEPEKPAKKPTRKKVTRNG